MLIILDMRVVLKINDSYKVFYNFTGSLLCCLVSGSLPSLPPTVRDSSFFLSLVDFFKTKRSDPLTHLTHILVYTLRAQESGSHSVGWGTGGGETEAVAETTR